MSSSYPCFRLTHCNVWIRFLSWYLFVSLFGQILGINEVLPDSGEGNASSISPLLQGSGSMPFPTSVWHVSFNGDELESSCFRPGCSKRVDSCSLKPQAHGFWLKAGSVHWWDGAVGAAGLGCSSALFSIPTPPTKWGTGLLLGALGTESASWFCSKSFLKGFVKKERRIETKRVLQKPPHLGQSLQDLTFPRSSKDIKGCTQLKISVIWASRRAPQGHSFSELMARPAGLPRSSSQQRDASFCPSVSECAIVFSVLLAGTQPWARLARCSQEGLGGDPSHLSLHRVRDGDILRIIH